MKASAISGTWVSTRVKARLISPMATSCCTCSSPIAFSKRWHRALPDETAAAFEFRSVCLEKDKDCAVERLRLLQHGKMAGLGQDDQLGSGNGVREIFGMLAL